VPRGACGGALQLATHSALAGTLATRPIIPKIVAVNVPTLRIVLPPLFVAF
jgi:hypothetical protein